MSVEEAISKRRSVRNFQDKPLMLYQLSQLLWSAQGITRRYKRAAPSAGATYPLNIIIVAGDSGIIDLVGGEYLYRVSDHSLKLIKKADIRSPLSSAALGPSFIGTAPLTLVITAVYSRTTSHYGNRGIRYVDMEAGHVGQNVSLMAVSMGLGSVMIGAFSDSEVSSVLQLSKEYIPLYIIPIGYPVSDEV